MVTLDIRNKRHEVRAEAFKAFEALRGQQGLTQDEQVEAFKTAATALRAAADLADEGAKAAGERNFEAHQAEKQAAIDEYLNEGLSVLEVVANGEEDEEA